jgi:hypothetical protein
MSIDILSVQRASESWEVKVGSNQGPATFTLRDEEGIYTEADIRDWVGKLNEYMIQQMTPDDSSGRWDCSQRIAVRSLWISTDMGVENLLRSPRRAAQWISKVVFDLAGQAYPQQLCKHVPNYVQHDFDWMSTWKAALEGMAAELTEAMAESLDNAQWYYEDNPEEFNRYRRGRVEDGKVVATSNEAEDRVALHYLATVTPYQLWSAQQEVRTAAVYALDDYLDEGSLVGDDGGETNCKGVAKAAREAFEELVKAIDKRITLELAEEAHRKACEAAAEAARPNYDRSPIWEAGT